MNRYGFLELFCNDLQVSNVAYPGYASFTTLISILQLLSFIGSMWLRFVQLAKQTFAILKFVRKIAINYEKINVESKIGEKFKGDSGYKKNPRTSEDSRGKLITDL